MKHLPNLTLSVLCILLVGCAAIKPGNDPVVVRAEQTVKVAFEVCDSFLQWEHANRATVPPEIQTYATALRDSGPIAFKTARTLTKAYKQNRSDENRANLDTALAVLLALQSESAAYITALAR